jgi:pyroglutamyl-peptidase
MDAKTLLITGFDPFGGETVNPSWEAVCRLPEQIGAFRLIKQQLPTVYGRAPALAIAKTEEIRPDAIVCVGQAGRRAAVTPEVIGINLREGRIADNDGVLLTDTPIDSDGPAAYFSTLPVRRMVDAIRAADLPAALSYSAGAFVCNDLLYSLLHHFRNTDLPIGFIHVPFLPEQAGEGVPSMTLEDIVKALCAAISVLSDEKGA